MLFVFRGLPLSGMDTALWADDFDSKFIRWTVEWGFHALFQSGAPLEVWDSNSYYPAPLTLAYSDSILSAQVFYAPLRMLGASPGAALYGTLAGFCVLGCLLSNIALVRLGCFSPLETLILLFGAHFSLLMTSFLYHYQLFGFELAPPFLLFLVLYVTHWQVADLAGALLAFSLAVTFSIYTAPMMVTLALVLVVVRGLSLVRLEGPAAAARQMITGPHPKALLAAALVATALYVVQFRPYFQVADTFPEQPYSETVVYSATPASILTEKSTYSLVHRTTGQEYGDWERAYFPGVVLLTSTVVFALLWAVGVHRLVPPHPAAALVPYAVALFLAAWVLSWGPYDADTPSIRYPFAWLAEVVPGLRSLRAPGRFGAMLGLPMAVFLVLVVHILAHTRLSRRGRRATLAILLLLLAAESVPTYAIHTYAFPHRAVYDDVKAVLEPGTPLLELPIAGSDHFGTIHRAMDQLMGSTIHWSRMVSGYGAKSTPDYQAAVAIDNGFKAGTTPVDEFIAFCRARGIAHVLVHLADYPEPAAAAWRTVIDGQGIRILTQNGDSLLLRLP